MKKVVGFIIVSVILLVSLSFKNTKNEDIYFENDASNNKNMLSMMLEQTEGVGDYKTVSQSSWPTDGYKFNKERSGCENGGELSWDDTKKTVIMSGNVSDKCYVYFDVWFPSIADYCTDGDNLASCVIDFGNQGSDISNIYMKMMRLYTINEISLTEEEARIIFEKYIRSRRPQIGTILVVNYCKDYLLVIGEDEENYQCMPLHRYQNSELEERLDIYNSPSYVNYEERFYVPKDTILFIKSFHIKNEILQKIMPKIKKQSTKGFQPSKKDQ